MHVNNRTPMLAQRLDAYFSLCDLALSEINEISPEVRMDELCTELWRPLEAPLMACALLSRKRPRALIEQLLSWATVVGEQYPVRRKFTASFGGLKNEKETPLSFTEMKRTTSQVISLNSIALCLSTLDNFSGPENRDHVERITKFADSIITEIHSQLLRKPAYIEPLKRLFQQVGRVNFEGLFEHVNSNIKEASKSNKFALFIISLSKVPLKIYPSEELEITLNFLEILASYYMDCKGLELREAFVNSLCPILLPLIEIVSAEVNIPKWDKVFCKLLLKRTFTLCEKQKYRMVTLNLAVIVLCLCNKDLFHEKWLGLCEIICSLVREGSIPNSQIKSILQLIWVYCNRYSEAFATQTSKISKIINFFAPINSKRLNVSVETLQVLFYGCAAILGPTQPQSLLRDFILPFLEATEGCSLENFPTGRITIAIRTLLLFGSLEPGQSKMPTGKFLDSAMREDVESLCDGYIHFKADLITRESLDRVRKAIGKVLVNLDVLLWDSSLYEFKPSNMKTQIATNECTAISCLKLIIEASASINPLIQSDLKLLELLVKYCAHIDDSIASKAIESLQKVLSTMQSNQEDMLKLYWLYSSQFERVPDRCNRALANLAKVFPLLAQMALCFMEEQGMSQKEMLPVLADLSIKCLTLLLNVSNGVRDSAFEALGHLKAHIDNEEPGSSEILGELNSLVEVSQNYLAADYLVHSGIISEFLKEICIKCPTLAGISKVSIMSRLQEIQSQLNGKSQHVDDELVIQWSYYLAALFSFGAPEANSGTLNKRMDGMRLKRLLSFSKEDSDLHTIKGFLRFVLLNIINDNDLVCESLCDAAAALDPTFLTEFFEVLEPYVTAASEDFRNVKYQVVRKNKRQDALKIDLTRLLSRVAGKLAQNSDPQYEPHQILRRYIIEAFYFCSEIDAEQGLPGLRYVLAELVRNYHNTVHNMHPRYEFFPFKLQTELFLSFRKWFDERRLGSISASTGITTELDSNGISNNESGSSVNSTSMLTLMKVSSQDVERTYAECLASLCHGLLSPLPVYRNESIPSSQVLRWVDSLISCETWGPPLIKVAIRNILTSNRMVLEKVVQKIFQADVVLKYPILSDAYFMAVCEALMEGKVDLPTHSIVALLTFKTVQGSSTAQSIAERVAKTWLKSTDSLEGGAEGGGGGEGEGEGEGDSGKEKETSGDLISSLLNSLCMLADQVVSELVVRVEYLLSSNLEGPIKTLICQWIQKIAMIPGANPLPTTLQNMAVLTLRYYQRDCLSDSYVLWDALLSWRHHVSVVIDFWAALVLRHRNSQLMEISSKVLQHFCQKRELVPYIIDTIIGKIEPSRCLLNDSLLCTKIVATLGRQDENIAFLSSSRIDALLQTSDRTGLPNDFAFGHLAVRWISDLALFGVSEIMECTEVRHLWEILSNNEYPPAASWIEAVELRQFDRGNDNGEGEGEEEGAIVALQWAVRCPIKTHALTSWKILTQRIESLCVEQVFLIIPIVTAYISKLCNSIPKTSLDSPRIKLSDLLSEALFCLRSISNQVLQESEMINETLVKIGKSLLGCEQVTVFAEALQILLRARTIITDISSLANLVRGYSHILTRSMVSEIVCSMISSIYQRGGNPQPGELPLLLISLLPAMISADFPPPKHLVEAASIICNLLEGHDRARTATRFLQSYGRKKYRSTLEGMRDLALIFSDDAFIDYSALLVYSLTFGVLASEPKVILGLAIFTEQWTRLVSSKLATLSSQNSDSPVEWTFLAESFVQVADKMSGDDNLIVLACIDSILSLADTTLLPIEPFMKSSPPLPLKNNGDLTGVCSQIEQVSKELTQEFTTKDSHGKAMENTSSNDSKPGFQPF